MKRIIAIMLCFVMILTSVSFVGIMSAYADETEEGTTEEVLMDTDEEDVMGDEISDEEMEEIKMISASRENVSFGTLAEGDSVEPIDFDITNDGNAPVSLKWVQTDAHDAFRVETLSDSMDIEPGGRLDCQLSVKEGLSKGDYSCTISFQDVEDPSCQTDMSVSVKIIEKEPEEDPDKEKKEDPEEKTEEKSEEKSEEKTEEKPEEKTEKKPEEKSEEKTEKKSEEKTEKKSDNKKKDFKITAVCDPKSGGYIAGTGTYKKGSSTVLTIFTNDGYQFNGWYKGGELVSEKETLNIKNIQGDASYKAELERLDYRIRVKANNDDYGDVSGGGWFDKGDSTTIKAKPFDGYAFSGWYEDGERVSKKESFKIKDIKEDRSFKAVFKSEKHKVTIDTYPSDAGIVEGEGKYKDDEDVKISAKANDGYVFRGFFLNNQVISTNDEYTIKGIDRDVSLTAYFEREDAKSYHLVSGVASKGGIISPSGELTISEGGEITYTIAPEDGYAIQEVSVDGNKMGPVRTVTLREISSDHQISVAFAPKKDNVNNVKKGKIISTKEAAKHAVSQLFLATEGDEKRSSTIITPEMYSKMKEEGTLEDALTIQTQSIVGMDNTEDLEDIIDDYNYDNAQGLYQIMDLSPDSAIEMIETGEDTEIIKKAYEYGILDIIINNKFLVPGKETDTDDVFEDNSTVNNLMGFVNGVLTTDEKMGMFEGKKMAVSLGITDGEDMPEEEKEALKKAAIDIDKYFYMTVMKKQEGQEAEIVTRLETPVEITLKTPDGKHSDCVAHLHEGKVEILEDIGNKSGEITIRTSTFSPYAFANKKPGSRLFLIIGAVALIALAGVGALVILRNRGERE